MITLSPSGALEAETAEDVTSEDVPDADADWVPDAATVERHALAVEVYT